MIKQRMLGAVALVILVMNGCSSKDEIPSCNSDVVIEWVKADHGKIYIESYPSDPREAYCWKPSSLADEHQLTERVIKDNGVIKGSNKRVCEFQYGLTRGEDGPFLEEYPFKESYRHDIVVQMKEDGTADIRYQ